MAGNKDWLATRLADQVVQLQNLGDKINTYKTVLALTLAQVADIQALCGLFVAVNTFTEQARATTLSLGQWRDHIYKGTPQGSPASAAPVFPTYTLPADSTIGILQQIRAYRDIILASPGYTDAIGEDLMIVATGGPIDIVDLPPTLKVQTGSGYEVTIAGPMHGNDAMRIEWQPSGSEEWILVGFSPARPAPSSSPRRRPANPSPARSAHATFATTSHTATTPRIIPLPSPRKFARKTTKKARRDAGPLTLNDDAREPGGRARVHHLITYRRRSADLPK